MPISRTPVSCPTSNDGPLMGVRARRLKNPLPRSCAMFVTAVLVAKIDPCMKGKASANARYDVVGNPGMLVAALNPEALIASRNSGKMSGGTITEGRAGRGGHPPHHAAGAR